MVVLTKFAYLFICLIILFQTSNADIRIFTNQAILCTLITFSFYQIIGIFANKATQSKIIFISHTFYAIFYRFLTRLTF